MDTLTFVPGVGSQRQCACVQILQDVEDDDNEQFLVTINTTSPNITITRDSSAVTIVDDDCKKIINTIIMFISSKYISTVRETTHYICRTQGVTMYLHCKQCHMKSYWSWPI